jgi:hypothetical protein
MNPVSGGAGAGFGPGYMGRGGGRGLRNQYYATGLTRWQRGFAPPYQAAAPFAFPGVQATAQQEADALKNQIELMEESIKAAQERIKELEEKEK